MTGLHGLRVAVTRPAGSGEDRLARLLKEAGAITEVVPTVAVLPGTDPKALDQAVALFRDYDWIVFTSRRAVDPFTRSLAEAGLRPEDLDEAEVRVCGIGPTTTQALVSAGLRPALIPERFLAESLVEALFRHEGGADGMAGKRVLFPRAEEGRDVVVEGLREAGAHVDLVAAYRTVERPAGATRLAELVRHEALDAVTFTSASAVRSFAREWAKSASGVAPPWPPTVALVAIGPATAESLRGAGLPVNEVADPHTLEGLVEALGRWAAGAH